MCLAVPALVTALYDDRTADVSLEGVIKRVSTLLLNQVAVGDYVLLHVGYALQRISVEDAEHTLALMAEARGTGDAA